MDDQLYEALLERLTEYIDRIQADVVDYQYMSTAYSSVVSSSLVNLDGIIFDTEKESEKSSGHHMRSFKGDLQVPTISKKYEKRFVTKIKNPDSSLGALSLIPIPHFVLPILIPVFDPRFRFNPITVPSPRVVPHGAPQPVTKRLWDTDPVNPTVPIGDLIRIRDGLLKRIGDLHNAYPELPKIFATAITYTAGIAAVAFAAKWLRSKPFGPVSFGALAVTGIASVANAAQENIDFSSQSDIDARLSAYDEYINISHKLADIETIIQWKQSNAGEIEGVRGLRGGFSDPLRKNLARASSSIPFTHRQVEGDNTFYDNSDWFYDFRNDWPIIRDIMFIDQPIASMNEVPDDLKPADHDPADTTTTYFKIVPSSVYKNLIERAESGDPVAARKVYKIELAKSYFLKSKSKDIFRRETSTAGEIDRDFATSREFYSKSRRADDTTIITSGDLSSMTPKELGRIEGSMESRDLDSARSVTEHLASIIQEPSSEILDKDSEYTIEQINEINRLLENYIIRERANNNTKRALLTEIQEISR